MISPVSPEQYQAFMPPPLHPAAALSVQQDEWYAMFPYVDVEVLATVPSRSSDDVTGLAELAPANKPYFVRSPPTVEDINIVSLRQRPPR